MSKQTFKKLFDAISLSQAHFIKEILTEFPSLINCQDDFGNSPLVWSAIQNDLNTIFLLIEYGGDIYLENKYGLCCLNYARGPVQRMEILKYWEICTPESKSTILGKINLVIEINLTIFNFYFNS
jgi:hypothetical protein